MSTDNPSALQLAQNPAPGAFQLTTYDDTMRMAEQVAKSGLFGLNNSAQAMCLFMLCAAEGIQPGAALRRFHVIEGRFAMRADAMQGEFQKRGGGILWHRRDDDTVAATFFADAKKMDKDAIERSKSRYAALRDGDSKTAEEHAWPGEECIIRTAADAWEKGISKTWKDGKAILKKNWDQSSRQMLTARCITEGVRLTDPGLIAGIVSEDEARDIAQNEHADLMEKAFSPKEDERTAALKKIIKDKRQMAIDAPTDADRKRLTSEASDLQSQLDNEEGERLAAERQSTATPSGTPVVTDHAPEVLPPEDNLPGLAAAPREDDWKAATFAHLPLKTSHSCFGKNLGELFDTGNLGNAQRIMATLTKPDGYLTKVSESIAAHKAGTQGPPHEKDVMLYRALIKASARLGERMEKEGEKA